MSTQEETYFQIEVRRYLQRYFNTYSIKTHGGFGSTPGTPDLICCIDGRFVAIECKIVHDGVVSRHQEAHIKRIKSVGGFATVLYNTEDWRDVLDIKLKDAGVSKRENAI